MRSRSERPVPAAPSRDAPVQRRILFRKAAPPAPATGEGLGGGGPRAFGHPRSSAPRRVRDLFTHRRALRPWSRRPDAARGDPLDDFPSCVDPRPPRPRTDHARREMKQADYRSDCAAGSL